MAYKPQVLAVTEGGTGAVTFTAYSVICGGTTATGALQNVSGVGTTGQLLTSNGAGALPTWQTQSVSTLGYAMMFASNSTSGLADSSTYFMSGANPTTYTATGNAATRFSVPKDGTVKAVYGSFGVTVAGSNENSTMTLWKNGSSAQTITSTFKVNANPSNFSNASMSTAVVAGDYLEIVMTTPSWGTNPTSTLMTVTVYIE